MANPRRRAPQAARKPAAPPPAPNPDTLDAAGAARDVEKTDGEAASQTANDEIFGDIAGAKIDWDAIERSQMREREELVRDIREIAATEDIEYGHLLRALIQAGWFFRLREVGALPHHTGGTLVTLAIDIGRTPVHVQTIDQVSIVAPASIPDPSTYARLNAHYSVIFLLFSRLPPPKASDGRADSNRQVDADASEPDEPKPFGPDWEPLNLVESRTPDGLPILYDPFNLGDPPDEIGESVLRILADETVEIMSIEALAAVYTRNQVVFDYLRETQPERLEQAHEILNRRRDTLTPETPTARTGGRAPRTRTS